MYLRITKRTNKDGSVVEYFQLAHNERHPETRKPVAKIIHNFGRVDQLDRQELVRLCQSIGRVCGLRFDDPLAITQDSAVHVGLPVDMKSRTSSVAKLVPRRVRTSRMFGSSASSITMRSMPGAEPPCGGAP